MSFINLSNEEKFALAHEAVIQMEAKLARHLTPEEYEEFIWEFMCNLYKPKYE